MIVSFSVENYHSIREKVVLDLRIPGTAPDLPRFRRSESKPDIRLPSVVVLIGPNGSGKTTLLRALITTAQLASSALPTDANNPIKSLMSLSPFFSTETRSAPTRFCVELEADWLAPGEARQLFRYELAVTHGASVWQRHFHYEGLSCFPKGRPRRLFERGGPGEPIYVSGEFGVKPKDERLKAVRSDTSVVATLAFLNVPMAMRIAESMRSVLESNNVVYGGKQESQTETVIRRYEQDPELRAWAEKHIRSSDLGIQGFDIHNSLLGNKVVYFKHHGLDVPVHQHFESSGTKRLFDLLPQIKYALDSGVPAVLDEVDGDLHVDIAGEVLDWFRSRKTNPNDAQLFVTSHNVGLLDDLEKEEVFIVEKDGNGATKVHGAQDVRGLRRDARLYPKYRSGVLGGLPKIG